MGKVFTLGLFWGWGRSWQIYSVGQLLRSISCIAFPCDRESLVTVPNLMDGVSRLHRHTSRLQPSAKGSSVDLDGNGLCSTTTTIPFGSVDSSNC